MGKPGISIKIPGQRELLLRNVISDYTGTLSYKGKLVAGVAERLRKLGKLLDMHILSADTRGTAKKELTGLPLQVHILQGTEHDVQKRDFAKKFDLREVAVFGNGRAERTGARGSDAEQHHENPIQPGEHSDERGPVGEYPQGRPTISIRLALGGLARGTSKNFTSEKAPRLRARVTCHVHCDLFFGMRNARISFSGWKSPGTLQVSKGEPR